MVYTWTEVYSNFLFILFLTDFWPCYSVYSFTYLNKVYEAIIGDLALDQISFGLSVVEDFAKLRGARGTSFWLPVAEEAN